jgi:site-specific DNA-cytosine methylase
MKILIACEESQVVCNAFRAKGHQAWSCDILPTSGDHPEWHIEKDVNRILGAIRYDMVIAFPPCTHLAVSGARWFPEKRKDGSQQAAIKFFMSFVQYAETLDIKLCIENPIGIMSTVYRKPDQILQPWQFGHAKFKATCLWLRGLPLLKPTLIIWPPCPYNMMDQRKKRQWGEVHQAPPGQDRAIMRSKTYQGIANAMADQWG